MIRTHEHAPSSSSSHASHSPGPSATKAPQPTWQPPAKRPPHPSQGLEVPPPDVGERQAPAAA